MGNELTTRNVESGNVEEAKVTVVLCTYNSDLYKTLATIESIIMQVGCKVQLLVADDGSKDNNFNAIELRLAQSTLEDYTLVNLSENKGTVKNLVNALEYVSYDFVKVISPGDFFYDENSLAKMVAKMVKDESSVCIGRAAHYRLSDGIEVLGRHNPVIFGPYREKVPNIRKAKRNQINYGDWVLGACVAFKTKDFYNCVNELERSGIRFAEDYSIQMVLAEGHKLSYVEDCILWYEDGTGISTSGDSRYAALLDADYQAHLHLFINRYPNDPDVWSLLLREARPKSRSLSARIIRAVLDPSHTLFSLRRKLVSAFSRPVAADVSKLERILIRTDEWMRQVNTRNMSKQVLELQRHKERQCM